MPYSKIVSIMPETKIIMNLGLFFILYSWRDCYKNLSNRIIIKNKFFSELLILLIIYGCAVLLIRELSVRWRLGLIGIFILGLAYGFYNEGIVTKTLLLSKTIPMNNFIYPTKFGINWAWALFINVWHALHAVL